MARVIAAWREHLGRRKRYAGLRGWFLSLYNRAVLRGWPLPGRGRAVRVWLTGYQQPVSVRLGTSDWLVLEEIFFNDEYGIARSFSKSDIKTIIDLGANVGYSVAFWKALFPEARVIAVEPDPDNLDACRRNVGQSPGVTLIEGCVTAETKSVNIDRSGGSSWGFKIVDRPLEDRSSVVQGYSMPDLIRLAEVPPVIDLLKCDIEGAEADLFADCREWIGRVRHMAIELHHPYRTPNFLEDLKKAGVVPDRCDVKDFGNHEVLYLHLPAPSTATASV